MPLSKDAEVEKLGARILTLAMKGHTALGPGLLESAYEVCLRYELDKASLRVERQLMLPVIYDGQQLDAGYRLDLLVEGKVVVEIKAVEKLMPIHMAQLLSYLKLGGFPLGYVLNFNVPHLRQGIKRLVT